MIYKGFIYYKRICAVMGRVIIKRAGFKCERCSHEWIPNNIKRKPVVCPKCKSPYWDRVRKKKRSVKPHL